ncbi:hypothetical protein N9458_03120 [Gammaproteobacteria bacterium]|nr:hypothetical protein [Gammaproteobacteria bacterium]
MLKFGFVGFDARIIESINHEIFDANDIFKKLENLDRGLINLESLLDKVDVQDIEIDTYWRFKGEFDHYSSRRELPLIFEEQDLLFKYILSLSIIFVKSLDVIVFSNFPHQGVDSVIKNCAKKYNKKLLFYTPSIFKNYCYLIEGEERNFKNLLPNKEQKSPLKDDYDSSPSQKLYYMEKEYFPKKNGLISKLKTFNYLKKYNKTYPFRILFKKMLVSFLHKGYRNINWLNSFRPSENKLKIYFPLHLQPELTTSNLGGIYYDQIYALKKLCDALEKLDVSNTIYLKENPKQNEINRIFLNLFQDKSNIEFISRNVSSSDLIDNCDLVYTISGTAGWEAIKSGKKCLLLGSTWYETAPGVYRELKELLVDRYNEVNNASVREWYDEHKKFLHFMQNDIAINEMDSTINRTSKQLDALIKTYR